MIKIYETRVNVTKFPDYTSQVWKLPDDVISTIQSAVVKDVNIVFCFETEDEVMHLVQLLQLVNVLNTLQKPVILHAKYLPYARQDKQVDNLLCFALDTFIGLIQPFVDTLVTLDVHNPSAEAFNNIDLINKMPKDYIISLINSFQIETVIFPDEGAKNRYSDLLAMNCLFATKVRDQQTGEITAMTIPVIESDQRILVVDDICDGGRTFIELAALLKQYNPELHLYVTHGIFSKGLPILLQNGYKTVSYVDNSNYDLITIEGSHDS